MNSLFLHIFENMPSVDSEIKTLESLSFPSETLGRNLLIDFYIPTGAGSNEILEVLLINDGQDLRTMNFSSILSGLYRENSIRPLLCVGIHAGPLRKFEYGTSSSPDYKGRGHLASRYMNFITDELVPAIQLLFPGRLATYWAFAGFSLGGLSALDICWKQSGLFRTAAVFSGSLWWRAVDKDHPTYQDSHHRIMHNQIQGSLFMPGMKFFFECGTSDETEDRNGNGIIDSIDDTKDLMAALVHIGYDPSKDIYYHEIDGGKHDTETWARAFPVFLNWRFKVEC